MGVSKDNWAAKLLDAFLSGTQKGSGSAVIWGGAGFSFTLILAHSSMLKLL